MILPVSLTCAQPDRRQPERTSKEAILARESSIWPAFVTDLSRAHDLECTGILLSRREPNHVFDDIEYSITAPVKENNISVENDSLPVVRQAGKSSVQICR